MLEATRFESCKQNSAQKPSGSSKAKTQNRIHRGFVALDRLLDDNMPEPVIDARFFGQNYHRNLRIENSNLL